MGGKAKHIIGIFTIMVFISACGGSSQKGEDRSIEVRFTAPTELSALPNAEVNRKATVDLVPQSQGEGVAASIDLIPAQDTTQIGLVWTGTAAEIPSGNYLFRLNLKHAWSPSSPTLQTSSNAEQLVTVAIFETNIETVNGEPLIHVDVAPGDFSLGADDDSDGLANFTEVGGLSSSPFLSDTDDDGTPDNLDIFPNVSGEWGDRDGDGIGDNRDNCIEAANTGQDNTDGDAHGDVCDEDADGDGFSSAEEASRGTNPLVADTDGDGVKDGNDNCPLVSNSDQVNSDTDGFGNLCDDDNDNDGLSNTSDNCPYLASADQTDSDGDGAGDLCSGDNDGDGVLDESDDCPTVANADQVDTDGDRQGNACDSDDDGDNLTDVEEETPGVDNYLTDKTARDTDGDGVADNRDNCPRTANADQLDTDRDDEGDACDCVAFDENIKSSHAVFVSVSGSDTNSGARNAPVKTIARGIALAQVSNKSRVYVAGGTYAENVAMANGVSVYGGFSLGTNGSTCGKNLVSNVTLIKPVTVPAITFSNIVAETRLEGVSVESAATSAHQTLITISSDAASPSNVVKIENSILTAPDISSGNTTAVLATNASPLFINDVIHGGDSQVSTAVRLVNSPNPKFVNNTILGGDSSTRSTVLDSTGSVPVLVNNILFTEGGNTQEILSFQDRAPSGLIVCKNNLLFGVDDPEAPRLYHDESLPLGKNYPTIAEVNAVDGDALGGNFDGNILTSSLGSLFVDRSVNNFHLGATSEAIDRGINPATTIGVTVLKDHDGRTRDVSPDLGAFER